MHASTHARTHAHTHAYMRPFCACNDARAALIDIKYTINERTGQCKILPAKQTVYQYPFSGPWDSSHVHLKTGQMFDLSGFDFKYNGVVSASRTSFLLHLLLFLVLCTACTPRADKYIRLACAAIAMTMTFKLILKNRNKLLLVIHEMVISETKCRI